ncbi:MAG: hypothetical protein MUD14_00125 [Hydrococcus sp. Prado102]|jgi:hypothetical protein|nr:hypothetical protein [Hydrococcus sp. Prado102]
MSVNKDRGDRAFTQECDRPSEIFSDPYDTALSNRKTSCCCWEGCLETTTWVDSSNRWYCDRHTPMEVFQR